MQAVHTCKVKHWWQENPYCEFILQILFSMGFFPYHSNVNEWIKRALYPCERNQFDQLMSIKQTERKKGTTRFQFCKICHTSQLW